MKLTYRKFPKIYRIEQEEAEAKARGIDYSLLEMIAKGEPFSVTEKLDGANSCIEVIKEDEEIRFVFYSHNKRLDEHNTLRGFYEYANSVLVPKLTEFYECTDEDVHDYLYGEWLVPHRVQYQDDKYNKWYLFSIYDDVIGTEMAPNVRQLSARCIGVLTPDFFCKEHYGEFDYDKLKELVGKSTNTLIPDQGEGIIVECGGVKAKIVSDKFKEVRRSKKPRPSQTESERFIDETVTEARVTKMIEKFKDEELLPNTIDYKHFSEIAQPLTQAIWEDVLEEESMNMPQLFDEKKARKRLNKIVPKYIRELIELSQEVIRRPKNRKD